MQNGENSHVMAESNIKINEQGVLEMKQGTFNDIIEEQTRRALWEVKNVIDCVPDELWDKNYCDMPCWKHVYHMLHSLDQWYINPRDVNFREPSIHEENLNNLDIQSDKKLSRQDINHYFFDIKKKIQDYIAELDDQKLLEYPEGCEYTRFTLILAQFRHLHTHMGMLMGFIIDDKNLWPRVLGLESPFPKPGYNKYF